MEQSETSHNFWDTIIKTVSAVIVSLSVAMASYQYKETVENEFMASIWVKQIDIYSKVVSISSVAATADTTSEKQEQLRNLRELYIGELRVVGDVTVNLPVAYFINELENCIKAGSCTQQMLNPMALSISRCVRLSLGKTWNRRFEEIILDSHVLIKPDEICS